MEDNPDLDFVFVKSRPETADGSLNGERSDVSDGEEFEEGTPTHPGDEDEQPQLPDTHDGGQELIRQLTSQVAYLQDELEASHATNHKLLEASVGPRYAAELGPTESAPPSSTAPVYGGAQAGLQGTRSEMASVEHLLDSENPSAGPGRARHGGTADASGRGAAEDANDRADAQRGGGKGVSAAAEKQRRQLEAALDAQKGKTRDLEMRLESLTESHEALKERHLAVEHRAFQNARALAAQVEAARERAAGERAAGNASAAQAREAHAEEVATLRKINNELRRQVQEAQDSIPDLIRVRTQESTARKAQEAASRAAYEARRDETLKAAREQLRRESDVLRAQLSQATQQMATLTSQSAAELKQAKDAAAKEAAALTDELGHLYMYASQLEDIIEGVRCGKYPTLLKEGARRVAVPQPGGGPLPPARERLRQLAAACTAAKCTARQLEGDRRLPALQQEVAALRERLAQYESAGSLEGAPEALEAEVRSRVEADVMQELQANSTVEYAAALEAENMRLRKAAQSAATQELSQTLALQSYKRAEERNASKGMRRTARQSLRRPQSGKI